MTDAEMESLFDELGGDNFTGILGNSRKEKLESFSKLYQVFFEAVDRNNGTKNNNDFFKQVFKLYLHHHALQRGLRHPADRRQNSDKLDVQKHWKFFYDMLMEFHRSNGVDPLLIHNRDPNEFTFFFSKCEELLKTRDYPKTQSDLVDLAESAFKKMEWSQWKHRQQYGTNDSIRERRGLPSDVPEYLLTERAYHASDDFLVDLLRSELRRLHRELNDLTKSAQAGDTRVNAAASKIIESAITQGEGIAAKYSPDDDVGVWENSIFYLQKINKSTIQKLEKLFQTSQSKYVQFVKERGIDLKDLLNINSRGINSAVQHEDIENFFAQRIELFEEFIKEYEMQTHQKAVVNYKFTDDFADIFSRYQEFEANDLARYGKQKLQYIVGAVIQKKEKLLEINRRFVQFVQEIGAGLKQDVKEFLEQRPQLFDDLMKEYENQTGLKSIVNGKFTEDFLDVFSRYQKSKSNGDMTSVELKDAIKAAIEVDRFDTWASLQPEAYFETPQRQELGKLKNKDTGEFLLDIGTRPVSETQIVIDHHSRWNALHFDRERLKDKYRSDVRTLSFIEKNKRMFDKLEQDQKEKLAEYERTRVSGINRLKVQVELKKLQDKRDRFVDFVDERDGPDKTRQQLMQVKGAIRSAEKLLGSDQPDTFPGWDRNLKTLKKLNNQLNKQEEAIKLKQDSDISQPSSPELAPADIDDVKSMDNHPDHQQSGLGEESLVSSTDAIFINRTSSIDHAGEEWESVGSPERVHSLSDKEDHSNSVNSPETRTPSSPQVKAIERAESDMSSWASAGDPDDVESLPDEDLASSTEALPSSSQETSKNDHQVDAKEMSAISADLMEINNILSSHKGKEVGEVKIGKLRDYVAGAKVLYGAKAPHEASQLCLLEVNLNGNVKSAKFKIAHRSQLEGIRISNEALPGIVYLQEGTMKDLPKVLHTALSRTDGEKGKIHPSLTASVQDQETARMVPKKDGPVSLDNLPKAPKKSSPGNKRGV